VPIFSFKTSRVLQRNMSALVDTFLTRYSYAAGVSGAGYCASVRLSVRMQRM